MVSKNKIAHELICEMRKHKPKAKYFIDLFGGGGSMSFTALQMGYKVLYNEYETDLANFMQFIIDRVKNNEKSKYGLLPEEYYQFVTREIFIEQKPLHTNYAEFCRLIYSFGNNQNTYLFGKPIEEFKRQGHNFIMFNCEKGKQYIQNHFKDSYYWHYDNLEAKTWNEKRYNYVDLTLKIEAIRVTRLYNDIVYNEYKDLSFEQFKNLSQKDICRSIERNIPTIEIKFIKRNGFRLKELEQLEGLEKLQQLQGLLQLERLEQLQRLEQLEQLTISNKSYEQVEINYKDEDVIIYCDPPYRSTATYRSDFDYNKFDEWVKNNDKTIFISEYDAPFKEIFSIEKRSLLSANKNIAPVLEKLYCNKEISISKYEQLYLF
jgi:site-specific DNA-adenine methylase